MSATSDGPFGPAGAAPELVVYSSPLCIPCEHLKRYLADRGLAFTVRDVMMDEEAGELLEDAGIFSTPVLSVDGDLIVGFDREAIDARLSGMT